MGSRIRENPENVFEVFVEIARPTAPDQEPFVLQKYPADYDDKETLKELPKFAFPCDQEMNAVDHFTFVLTDVESMFKFGFCRHAAGAQTCLCIISCLPWYGVFYKFLNYLAERLNRNDNNDITCVLSDLYKLDNPNPGEEVEIILPDFKEKFSFYVPDTKLLPSIPESRNLTEYYNAVDTGNMMLIFASMLHERRILITSKKLSRLTACVHASAELLYPMHWQHLYIPVLPAHLIDYCSAPMPYIIGIHSTLLEKAKMLELGDAVILDADENTVHTEHNDLENMPQEIVAELKKKLRSHQSEKTKSNLMGDGVARAFLRALARLIGSYREGLKKREGEAFVFDKEQFVASRPASMESFMETMVHLQIFSEFVDERIKMLRHSHQDEFEMEVQRVADKPLPSAYNFQTKMKKVGKEGREKFADIRNKMKEGMKEVKSRMNEDKYRKEEEGSVTGGSLKSRPKTMLITNSIHGQRPPRPPPPNRVQMRRGSHDRNSKYDSSQNQSHSQWFVGPSAANKPRYQLEPALRASVPLSRHYQVLDLDDLSNHLNGEKVDGIVSGDRHISTTDDIDDQRIKSIGLDLLNDPEIQNIYKRSFSMEDIAGVDTGQQNLISPESSSSSSITGSGDLIGGPASAIVGTSSLVGALDTSRPTPPPRLKKVERMAHADSNNSLDSSNSSGSKRSAENYNLGQLINFDANIGTALPRPVPQPRQSKAAPVEENLIRLDSGESPEIEFDPLKAGNKTGGSEKAGDGDLEKSGEGDTVPTLRPKPNLSRTQAFYDKRGISNQRHSSTFAHTPNVVSGTQALKDRRAEFMMSDTRPVINFDPFDPLSSVTAPKQPVSQIVMSPGGNEDHLLREWNLDFNKIRMQSGTTLNRNTSYAQAMKSPVKPAIVGYGNQNQFDFNKPVIPRPSGLQPTPINSNSRNFSSPGLASPNANFQKSSGLHTTNSDPRLSNRVDWTGTGASSSSKPASNVDLLMELDPLANLSSHQTGVTSNQPTWGHFK